MCSQLKNDWQMKQLTNTQGICFSRSYENRSNLVLFSFLLQLKPCFIYKCYFYAIFIAVKLLSGKTHGAAFCGSLALLAGSDNRRKQKHITLDYASGAAITIRTAKVELTADCNKMREDIARLIYLYLGKHDLFSAFHC